MSQPQTIYILEKFKGFFGCKIVLVATHQHSEKIQRLFCLQKCLSRKPSISWKYSKTFSPAKMSQLQIIDILEIFKEFFARKIVLAQIIDILELFKDFFAWKIFLAATIKILKIFKDSFACKIVLAANHLHPGNIQRIFRLQNCLSRKSSISWKCSKTFSPAKLSQPKSQISWKYSKIFRLQKCLSRKSSISRKYSKTFSPAKLSQQQPINTLKIFKDFFACKTVLVANYRKTGKIQRLFRLQNCLSSNPSKFSKYSKTPSPAKLSYLQIIDILEILKDFFGCKIVLVATHQ